MNKSGGQGAAHLLTRAHERDRADVVGDGDERGAREVRRRRLGAPLLEMHVPERCGHHARRQVEARVAAAAVDVAHELVHLRVVALHSELDRLLEARAAGEQRAQAEERAAADAI